MIVTQTDDRVRALKARIAVIRTKAREDRLGKIDSVAGALKLRDELCALIRESMVEPSAAVEIEKWSERGKHLTRSIARYIDAWSVSAEQIREDYSPKAIKVEKAQVEKAPKA